MASLAAAPLGQTQSVCPACLRRIPARREARGDEVHLLKRCPEHGEVSAVVWRGPPSYDEWGAARRARPAHPAPLADCPFDCALCAEHPQPTCCALLEVTSRCNLRCPCCFAAAGGDGADPSLAALERQLRGLLARAGPCNVQLSGGEPTLRDDLPELIALGLALGVPFFQLNTNGLRLAKEPGLAHSLQRAGLGCVFLQFDGLDDGVYRALRGAPLLAVKREAVARCAEAGLGVVLVPTLVPGVNTDQLGGLVRFALAQGPAARGVHFQPVAYLGRYPRAPEDADRFTLPEVLRALELQTGGEVKAADFHPPEAENPHCSFSGAFVRGPTGGLAPAPRAAASCCARPPRSAEGRSGADLASAGSRRARQYVASRWALPPQRAPAGAPDALDAFLDAAAARSFCISGMAFQDAWTLDLERLRDCFLHVALGEGAGLAPFCAFNLTNAAGAPLHRTPAAQGGAAR